MFLDRTRRVIHHRVSPATVPQKSWHPARRVAISDDTEDEPTVVLVAPDAYAEGVAGWDALRRIIDDCGLNAREWRVMQRHFRNETLGDVGALWGYTAERARQIEVDALTKLRRALKAKGLVLEDLL